MEMSVIEMRVMVMTNESIRMIEVAMRVIEMKVKEFSIKGWCKWRI